MTTPGDKLASARAFVDAVREWHETDKGRLATLRRCAGDTIAEALDQGRRIAWFFQLLNRFGGMYGEENVFLVATLLAFDRHTMQGGAPFNGSFGATMEMLKSRPDASDASIERRFAILLDADLDPCSGGELPFRLRQTVKLVLSKNVGIDWPQLLSDLRSWSHPDKYIQKQWARDFYAPATPAVEALEAPAASY